MITTKLKLPSIFQKKSKGTFIKRCDRCKHFKKSSANYGICDNPKTHILSFAYEPESKVTIQVRKHSVCKYFNVKTLE